MTRNQRKRKKPLTIERLREVIHYDPLSGEMRWRVACAHRNKVGGLAGNVANNGYLIIGIDNGTYLAHRLAWFYMTGEWPDQQIDHIDLCRLNNRWVNLREASHGQNVHNTRARKHNSTGLKGVTFVESVKKYHSRIMFQRELHLLGYFDTAEEAHAAYCAAAVKLHGEFARST